MNPARLAELEAYYSQNDDLYEAHGAVLECIGEIKRLQAALLRAEHHNLPDKPCPVCAAMAEEDAL